MGYYFNRPFEINSIYKGMNLDLYVPTGTEVLWYLYREDASEMHPVYDEPYPGAVQDWATPFTVPVLAAMPYEGPSVPNEGFYTTDRLNLVISNRVAQTHNLGDLQPNRKHLKDRIIFEGVVYSPDHIQVSGHIGNSEVVIAVDCAEVDPDELVNSPDFIKYARF